jgi:hypothetical protein
MYMTVEPHIKTTEALEMEMFVYVLNIGMGCGSRKEETLYNII